MQPTCRNGRIETHLKSDALRDFIERRWSIPRDTSRRPGRRCGNGNGPRSVGITEASLRGGGGCISPLETTVAAIVSGGPPTAKPAPSEVRIWDFRTGREIFRRKTRIGNPRESKIVFSPDGSLLACCNEPEIHEKTTPREIKVWDVTTQSELWSTSIGSSAYGGMMVFTPDGKRLALSWDQAVKIWDARTGQPLPGLRREGDTIPIAFSPNGKWLASSSIKDVEVIDLESGQQFAKWTGNGELFTAVLFTPDNRRLITASSEGSVRIWDPAGGQELLTMKGSIGPLAMDKGGSILVGPGSEGALARIWNAAPLESPERDAENRLPSLEQTALSHVGRRDWELAAAALEEVLAFRIARWGIQDPGTIAVQRELAETCSGQGYSNLRHYDRAEKLFQEVLAFRLDHIEPDDPDTLALKQELGWCKAKLGKLDESESLFREVIASRWVASAPIAATRSMPRKHWLTFSKNTASTKWRKPSVSKSSRPWRPLVAGRIN